MPQYVAHYMYYLANLGAGKFSCFYKASLPFIACQSLILSASPVQVFFVSSDRCNFTTTGHEIKFEASCTCNLEALLHSFRTQFQKLESLLIITYQFGRNNTRFQMQQEMQLLKRYDMIFYGFLLHLPPGMDIIAKGGPMSSKYLALNQKLMHVINNLY